jgi:hypothetical protein
MDRHCGFSTFCNAINGISFRLSDGLFGGDRCFAGLGGLGIICRREPLYFAPPAASFIFDFLVEIGRNKLFHHGIE